jgi:hypothetical protein
MTPRFDLDIEQGAVFENTFNWYAGGHEMRPIEDVQVGYPTIITVTAHLLPSASDTPVIISGVEGCTALNSTNLGIEQMERIDADTFRCPVSTVGKEWTPGTGEVTYHLPTDITNFTARMKIKKNWYDKTVIAELTTENGGITLVVDDASISIKILATVTAGFDFDTAWYDIEMVDSGGTPTRVVKGLLTLDREITT